MVNKDTFQHQTLYTVYTQLLHSMKLYNMLVALVHSSLQELTQLSNTLVLSELHCFFFLYCGQRSSLLLGDRVTVQCTSPGRGGELVGVRCVHNVQGRWG